MEQDGSYLHAEFDEPRGVAVDSRGMVYIADYGTPRQTHTHTEREKQMYTHARTHARP